MIVTKDEDFAQRSLTSGSPPKVVRVRAGNCGTQLIEALLRDSQARVKTFIDDPVESILIIVRTAHR